MSKHNGGTLRYTVDGIKKCHRIPAGATNIILKMDPDNTFKVGDRVRQINNHDVKGTITNIYMGKAIFSQAETYAELDHGGPDNSYLTICFELDRQPEPPRGSIVLDQYGYAFQRKQWRGDDGWAQAGFTQSFPWEELLRYNGKDLEVVYQP